MYKIVFPLFCGIFGISASVEAQDDPRAVVKHAIQAQGGEAKIARLKVVKIKFWGTATFPGVGESEITLDDAWQMPGQYRTTMRMTVNGKELLQTIVLDRDKGWISVNGQTQDVPAESLAEMKEQKYAEDLDRLGFLNEKGIEIVSADEIKVGGRPAVGVKVTSKGHREVRLYFDKENGLLVKRHQIIVESPGKEEVQEVFFSDYKDYDGLKHYTRLVANRDGKKFIEGKLLDAQFLERIDPKEFARP
jgi:hypothetical protein